MLEKVLEERIILDCIILKKYELGWKEVHNYIKYPSNHVHRIFLNRYHDSLLNCNIEYEHPYVTRWASLRDPYICKKFEKRNNKLINRSNQEINHKINVVKITAACIGLFVSKILFKLIK